MSTILDELNDEQLAALQTEVARLRKVLAFVQWVPDEAGDWCLACGARREEGHYRHCRVKEALE